MNSNLKLKGPWRMTFDTNPDKCNIKCIMCEEHSKYNQKKRNINRIMDFSLIESVLKESVKLGLHEVIPSTMGEPLLYSQFERFIELVRKYGLKLNLTTNGTFPRLGVDKWGELILPIASDVKISINGSSKKVAESIMNGLDYEKQMQNINRFIQIRDTIRKSGVNSPTVTLQVTFMERNLTELPDLLRLAIKLDIDRLKGHHLWITHPEVEEESLQRNTEAIRRWDSIALKMKEISESSKLKNGKTITLDNVYEISDLSGDGVVPSEFLCPFLGKEGWIAWDGTFNVCCAPDNLRQTLGNFGNVTKTDFMDLWNSPEYNNLVGNWGNYSVCKKCNMRRPIYENGGHLIGYG